MIDTTVALVTGANKGLGREVAGQLARRGMTVLLGSRDPGRGAEAAGELTAAGFAAWPIALEVTDPATVETAARQVREEYGRLDVLVNNAGISTTSRAAELDAERMRETFEVNVFGTVTVTRAFLPLLARSAAPRVVNVSSTTASLTLTSGGTDFGGDASTRMAYSCSKTALNMLTVQYAAAVRADPALARIKINAATPGYVATEMNGNQGTRSVEQGARVVVELATLLEDGPTGGFFNEDGPVPW